MKEQRFQIDVVKERRFQIERLEERIAPAALLSALGNNGGGGLSTGSVAGISGPLVTGGSGGLVNVGLLGG